MNLVSLSFVNWGYKVFGLNFVSWHLMNLGCMVFVQGLGMVTVNSLVPGWGGAVARQR